MGFILRLTLWITGGLLLFILSKGIGLGFGSVTQTVISFWIFTIYFDAKYHDFNFIR
jgi:hypothetical protein